jgi:hypothetical protein
MTNVAPLDQAKQAILHTLAQIRANPALGWYAGEGTQTFALLTKAAATLYLEPVERVRDFYRPQNPRDPAEKS